MDDPRLNLKFQGISFEPLPLNDGTAWYLAGNPKGIKLYSRKEAQEKMKKSHPTLYAFMKRHENKARGRIDANSLCSERES